MRQSASKSLGSARRTLISLAVKSQPQCLGDDLFHDLAGAAANGEQTNVPVGAGDVVLFDIAGAAVNLHAVVGDALGEVAGVELGHRDLALRVPSFGERVDRQIGELPR